MKGYRSLDRFRGDAPVRAWLLRIVANDAKNAVRGQRPPPRPRGALRARCAGAPAGADPVGEHVADAATRRAAAGAARPCSTERDREVLACRFVAGLSEPETAAALGVPLGTVKSRTARALGRARALLDGAGGGRRWLSATIGAAPASRSAPALDVPARRHAGRRRARRARRRDLPSPGSRWRRAAARSPPRCWSSSPLSSLAVPGQPRAPSPAGSASTAFASSSSSCRVRW